MVEHAGPVMGVNGEIVAVRRGNETPWKHRTPDSRPYRPFIHRGMRGASLFATFYIAKDIRVAIEQGQLFQFVATGRVRLPRAPL